MRQTILIPITLLAYSEHLYVGKTIINENLYRSGRWKV